MIPGHRTVFAGSVSASSACASVSECFALDWRDAVVLLVDGNWVGCGSGKWICRRSDGFSGEEVRKESCTGVGLGRSYLGKLGTHALRLGRQGRPSHQYHGSLMESWNFGRRPGEECPPRRM